MQMGENYGCGGYWNPAPPRNDPTMMYGGRSYGGYYQQRPAVFADMAYYFGSAPDNIIGVPTAMPAAPAAPTKPSTPAAPSKPTTPAAPAKPAVPAAAKTKAPKKPDTPKAPATSKLPATKPPAVTKPDPPKTPAQPAIPKAPEQPAVPEVTQPKVSAVPCRTCQQQARQYNLRLNSGTPGCPECEYLAAFLSYHGGYPTTVIPNQQVQKYNAAPHAEGRERASREREGRGKEVRNSTRSEESKKLPEQSRGKNSRAQEKEVFRKSQGEGSDVRNIASKKKSKKPPVRSRGRYLHGHDVERVLEDEGLGGEDEGGEVYVANKKSKAGFCFCCVKIVPDDDDEEEGEEGEEEETGKNQGKKKPEPQQLVPADPYGFMPPSHFRARNHNPHMREAMFDGYTPDPTRHPHPAGMRHMGRQIAFHV